MKHFVFTIFLFLIVSCSSNEMPDLSQEQIEELKKMGKHDQIAGQIILVFTEKMKREKQLLAIGTGGGGSPEKGLSGLGVTFESYQKLDLKQARHLLIECVQEFLRIINATSEFQSHAAVFPFTYKNIEIVILFGSEEDQSEFVKAPFIASVRFDSLTEGRIFYKSYSSEETKTFIKEPYEEALEIIKQEKSQQ